MASILDKYGIKEVADVVFYELDSKGAPSAPVLYLDTLKVSTIEQSAEVTDATGGKGNVKLISWDSNKEVSATFEDALFSVKSLEIMFGGEATNNGTSQEVLKTVPKSALSTSATSGKFDVQVGQHTVSVSTSKATFFKYSSDGKSVVPISNSGIALTTDFDFMTFDLLDCDEAVSGLTINIDASTFGGTYYITGDTYARSQESGRDEYLQFIIPKAKVSSEDLSLTMEADGDPATFSMNIRALKSRDGSMFKLVKYTIGSGAGVVKNKGVASVLKDYDVAADDENAGYESTAYPVSGSKPTGN
jgi:hypothetical protein